MPDGKNSLPSSVWISAERSRRRIVKNPRRANRARCAVALALRLLRTGGGAVTQKHTPGPWVQTCESVDPDWHIVTTQGGAIIANVFAPQSANARLVTAAPDTLDALEGLAQFFALPDENSIGRFDRLAEQYRRETGKWAPGKSIPAAYNNSDDGEARRADYDAWVQSKVEAARAAIAKARGQQ